MASRKSEVEEAQKKFDFEKNTYTAELDTSKGPIRLVFFADKAPGHVKNFLALAKIGFYNGLKFHRIIKTFMIQGGCPLGTGTGDAGYKIKAEFNSTPHVPGVLSMARSSEPDSAGSQFFICTETHSHLDRNYTAFGKVADADALATVKAIAGVKVDSQDRPVKPEEATIKSVRVIETAKA